jgi:hypothetical protein
VQAQVQPYGHVASRLIGGAAGHRYSATPHHPSPISAPRAAGVVRCSGRRDEVSAKTPLNRFSAGAVAVSRGEMCLPHRHSRDSSGLSQSTKTDCLCSKYQMSPCFRRFPQHPSLQQRYCRRSERRFSHAAPARLNPGKPGWRSIRDATRAEVLCRVPATLAG